MMRTVFCALALLVAACDGFVTTTTFSPVRTVARPNTGATVIEMANLKQSKKRARQNDKRRMVNMAWRSKMKTYMKKTDAAMEKNEPEQVKENFDIAVSTIQKCAQRNIIHKNKSNRLVSRLSLKFNAFRRGEDPKTQAVSQKPKADTSLFAQQLAEYEEYAASLQAA